jgi:hypothetical protein
VLGYVEALQSVYRAHGVRSRFQSEYNWLGGSLEVAVGLRFPLW